MHICIVGGIFDKPAGYRDRHSISPETVLADGLRQRGWQVTLAGHSAPLPPSCFDLVHVHHFGRAALRLAAATARPPFVLTTHDPFAMNGLPVGWRRRLTDGFVLRKANAIVALSNAERDFLARRRRILPEHIAVIPNGISTSVFERTSAPAEPTDDLLFVGQLQPFKGLDYLLKALPAVRAACPRVKLRVVYQTGALLDRYRKHASQLGLNGCVEFAGAKTAAGLAQLYSSATVVISPSLGECLSTVVLEAMCCGAAVVATDVGGIREQLDEESGVIVPPRDSAALAGAISALLADATRRRRLGDAACRKAHSQFTVRQMIDRHVRLYEELLETHARAA
ncbi:MAG: glycosyltransferase family 4 protein [Bryobacteraceae bacterium]|jgi:glycosyltransferase involved in cell wall biosynthesis